MTIDEAIGRVIREFPFQNYMTPEDGWAKGAYWNIAGAVGRHLRPGDTILDFGSGPCEKTAVLQLLGYRCTAYDDLQDYWHALPGNREKILAFAAGQGIDLRVADGGPLPFDKASFDMVMLHDVLEHLHDSPRELLNDLLETVKPEGLLFVSVPNAGNIRKRVAVLCGRTNLPPFEGYYWYPGPWRGHIREYVRDDLAKLAVYLGLEVLELRGCDHMLQRLPRSVRPFYRLITAIFPGWKDSWSMVARKKPGWTPKRALTKPEFESILAHSNSYDFTN